MKLQGFVGKGSGKLGASVFAVRKGVQIVRQYTDRVANPNTRPQVEQRAKFKMLSQLAAVVTNDGMFYDTMTPGASMRNEFMKRNMSAVDVPAGQDEATVKLDELALTSGTFICPPAIFDTTEKAVVIDVSAPEYDDVAGAVAVVMTQPEVGHVIGGPVKLTRQEGSGDMDASLYIPTALVDKTAVLVWVYRFRDAAARARYEEAVSSNATTVTLAFSRMIAEGDIVVSSTGMATPTE